MKRSSTLIQIKDVVLARGDSILTMPISTQFESSQIWHVTGENGAGKTTFLMTILGLLPLYQGYIDFKQDTKPLYIGHRAGLNLSLTVIENLQFLTSLYDHSFNREVLLSAITNTGLEGYEDVLCSQLSSGQKRRVQLARLWLPTSPAIWVLDEPLTALDKGMIDHLEHRFSEHVSQGGLILVSSHQDFRCSVYNLNLDHYRYIPEESGWLPDE